MTCATRQAQAQILSVLEAGSEAVLARPRVRDWIYAVDVAEAVAVLIEAGRPQHRLYNISTGAEWSALQWGRNWPRCMFDRVGKKHVGTC